MLKRILLYLFIVSIIATTYTVSAKERYLPIYGSIINGTTLEVQLNDDVAGSFQWSPGSRLYTWYSMKAKLQVNKEPAVIYIERDFAYSEVKVNIVYKGPPIPIEVQEAVANAIMYYDLELKRIYKE